MDETYMGGLERNKHESRNIRAGRGAVGKTPGAARSARRRSQASMSAKRIRRLLKWSSGRTNQRLRGVVRGAAAAIARWIHAEDRMAAMVRGSVGKRLGYEDLICPWRARINGRTPPL